MAEKEIVRLRRRDRAGWWGGREPQLTESQAAQQSGFGGTINDCKVTEENVTQLMLSAQGNRRSGYKLWG